MNSLNVRLIVQLSLFGMAMAIATVFWIPSNSEPIFWLIILLGCAFLIARKGSANPFLHGLLVGILNSAWITTAHILFFETYIANHPQEAAMMKTMPMPDAPRLMMLIIGPIVGVISGIVLGLFAFIASKLVKKP